ncbi:MAG: hypothetical protein AB7G15_00930 [Alphaproteobacteria bacterium]
MGSTLNLTSAELAHLRDIARNGAGQRKVPTDIVKTLCDYRLIAPSLSGYDYKVTPFGNSVLGRDL